MDFSSNPNSINMRVSNFQPIRNDFDADKIFHRPMRHLFQKVTPHNTAEHQHSLVKFAHNSAKLRVGK